MPYITIEERKAMRHGAPPLTAGQLNYAICKAWLNGKSEADIKAIVMAYWASWGTSQDYALINHIVGAIICAGIEINRRTNAEPDFLLDIVDDFYTDIAVPYEDTKCKLNGDIFETRKHV